MTLLTTPGPTLLYFRCQNFIVYTLGASRSTRA